MNITKRLLSPPGTEAKPRCYDKFEGDNRVVIFYSTPVAIMFVF